jgi:hypothetical protein
MRITHYSIKNSTVAQIFRDNLSHHMDLHSVFHIKTNNVVIVWFSNVAFSRGQSGIHLLLRSTRVYGFWNLNFSNGMARQAVRQETYACCESVHVD